ncbi:MAG TPA: PKD domain-containing protein [Bacteroidia bacterium]|nr:PKD domain-containing protein [Bacteroidia bacterium]
MQKNKITFYIFLSLLICVTKSYSQTKFYETKFNGGVTCAGYSPGVSPNANGVFQIHIAPGSTIHKAFLMCGEMGDGSTANFLLDGNQVSFIHNVTQVSPKFGNQLYGDSAAVHAIDVTSLIIPTDTVYTFTGIQLNTTVDFFTDFYLYVAYANPALPSISSAIFLNTTAMGQSVSHYLKLQNKFPASGDVALAFLMGYMCGSGDGENVAVNGTPIGLAYGPDANNLPGSCGGPAASFYYENKILTGLNDDIANQAITGPEVLSNINGLVTPGSDSIFVQYNHQNNGVDNSIWAAIVTYNDAIEIKNFCFGDTTLFLAQDSIGYVAFQWNFDDPSSGPNNISYYANTSHVYTAPGNYVVTLIRALTVPPFVDTSYYPITINPTPTISLGSDTTLCIGQTLVLNPGIYNSYLWSNGTTLNSLSVTANSTIAITVDNFGCKASDSIDVTFTPCANTVANLSCTDTIFCEKQCIDFFDLSTNSPTTWLWQFTGASPSSSTLQNPPGICYNNYGSFDVQLIACNNIGCDTLLLPSFISEFQSPPAPLVIWQNDSLICTSTNVTYAWYSTLNPNAILGTNYFYLPNIAGTYYVVIADTNGCDVSSIGVIANVGWNDLTQSNIQISFDNTENSLLINCNGFNTDDYTITVYDGIGRNVFTEYFNCSELSIKLPSSFLPGFYLITISNNKTKIEKRIVKL